MARYVKKPIEIDAFRWTGGPDQTEDPEWIVAAIKAGQVKFVGTQRGQPRMTIETLEGTMIARPGDWVLRGVKGEIYPCRDDIFRETYEVAAPNTGARADGT